MSAPANNGNTNNGYPYDQYETPRTSRRIQMACQFCRARKLKCDGIRPQCTNCSRRNCACSYVPVPQSPK
ncbi:hypothetical protein C8F01DRAFT_482175 [Mycena amicta]|nr:hypothetical protein C8F01DRAFT_482175 [Mycena amicta]